MAESQSRGRTPLVLPPEYIQSLEAWLGLSDLTGPGARTYANAVAQITYGLRDEHAAYVASRYLKNEETRKAYLFYYSTINMLKNWPPLRELARSGFFESKTSLRHLDLGSGPGTATWGLSTYLKHEQPGITRLDTHSTDALKENLRLIEQFATRFSKHIAPLELRVTTETLDLATLRPSKDDTPHVDLITMMNILAELDEAHDPAIIELLTSRIDQNGAIIMIEPSRKGESRRALKFRDKMVATGFHVYAPCCKTGNCPALEEEGNWCHTEIPWQRPEFIKAIDDVVGTLRLSLKSTYSVFLKKQDLNLSRAFDNIHPLHEVGRVVSERFDEKGRVRMFVCNEDGRREFVMNKRDKSEKNRDALSISRYDLIHIAGVEVREHDVKVGKEAVIHKLSGAEGR